MVAGQAIKTGPQTEAFDEGYDRIFGQRKPGRGRYRYDAEAGQVVSVDADWTDEERKAPHITEGIAYSNLTATDGTVLDSRRKHRDYMRAHGLSMASDFTNHWQKAEKERERVLSGEADTKERREIVGRLLHEAK